MLRIKSSAIRLLSLVVSVFVTATAFGCAESADNPDESAVISFTDALGREVRLTNEPTRVAALIGSFAEVWQLSGGTLCAAADDAWDDFALEMGNAVNIGGAHSPNLELLLAADPDFVLASASTAADVDMESALKSAGITVAYFDVDNFDDYLEMLDICTHITGRKDLYDKNGAQVKKRIEEIKSDFSASETPEECKRILLLRASSTTVKAKGSDGTVLGEMLKDVGCVNVADSDEYLLESLSVEGVIRAEPYRVFVVTMGNDDAAAKENISRMMKENPAWGTLSAVSEGRVHVMDRRLFNIKPNARWADAYEELCNILKQ